MFLRKNFPSSLSPFDPTPPHTRLFLSITSSQSLRNLRQMSIVRTKKFYCNMSQAPSPSPNFTISSSSSKVFSIEQVDEKGGESKILLDKKSPNLAVNFFSLMHLSTDVKFSSELKDRKSLRFSAFALNVESELRGVFKSLRECKVVDVKSSRLGGKTLAVVTLDSGVELKKKEKMEKLRKYLEKKEVQSLFRLEGFKVAHVSKELYDHYNRNGKGMCGACGKKKLF